MCERGLCCQGSLSAGQCATSHHHTHDPFVSETSVSLCGLYVVQVSPPAPNNSRKSTKIVRKVTSVFQSMRENMLGAASHSDLHATLAASEQQPDNEKGKQNNQNRRKSRRLGNVLMALDDVCTCVRLSLRAKTNRQKI